MEVIVHTHTSLLADIYHDWPGGCATPIIPFYSRMSQIYNNYFFSVKGKVFTSPFY